MMKELPNHGERMDGIVEQQQTLFHMVLEPTRGKARTGDVFL